MKFLFFFIIIIFVIYIKNANKNLGKYKRYINNCKKLRYFKIKHRNKSTKNIPFISICIPLYNMEKYIERAILSVIKQKFQNFEIIIVNDNSNDNSKNIIKDFQTKDNRIKIIEHNNNLGVYSSRIEGVFNSRGVYIMLFDPDDMVVNPDLFQRLYRYNSNNLDIIEFSVLHQKEGKDEIILPNRHSHSHFHNFNSKVINQPELSEIIFYVPNTKQYTAIICRTIWNKIIRKKVILKAINYIERDFNNQYLITADDISLKK